MKKIILLLSLAAISAVAFSQTKFGVQGGLVLSNGTYDFSDPLDPSGNFSFDGKAQPGASVGALMSLPIGESFALRPEMNITYKNTKFSESGAYMKFHTVYLDIPVNMVYQLKTTAGTVFMGGGPNLGIGGWGEIKNSAGDRVDIRFDGKTLDKLSSDDNDYHLRAIDFGVGLTGGITLSNGMFVNAGYVFGLSNIDPDAGLNLKTNELSLKMGFMF